MTDGVPLGSIPCERFHGALANAARTCSAPSAAAPQAERAHLLLRFSEARQLLRLSRNTVYSLAARGEIPGARKVGKEWRFRRDLLLEWLASGESPTSARRQSR